MPQTRKKKISGERRRGDALASAILDAAWNELKANGYSSVTMDAVALRAGTSKPVIYRRWRTRAELVHAAIRAHSPLLSTPIPDTGSLRGDVLFLLHRVAEGLNRIGTETLFGLLAELFLDESGFSRLQSDVLRVSADVMHHLVERAVARREIRSVQLSRRALTLPLDLTRHEVLIRRGPLPKEVLLEIVDDVFMPLIAAARRQPPKARL
jgi:AcrR family transcriptional regulator